MSADNYWCITRHPKGGYALLMGFLSLPGEPAATDRDVVYGTLKEALAEYESGQGEYGKYWSEYGLTLSEEAAADWDANEYVCTCGKCECLKDKVRDLRARDEESESDEGQWRRWPTEECSE